jgi:hypothetical protein
VLLLAPVDARAEGCTEVESMKRDADRYEYVRNYYGVPAYVGVKVTVNGRTGVIVQPRAADQYVYILFDGDKRMTGPFHPTDVTYQPVGTDAR